MNLGVEIFTIIIFLQRCYITNKKLSLQKGSVLLKLKLFSDKKNIFSESIYKKNANKWTSHFMTTVQRRLFLNLSNRYFQGDDFQEKIHWITFRLRKKSFKYNLFKSLLKKEFILCCFCLLYTSPSPRDGLLSRMPSSA